MADVKHVYKTVRDLVNKDARGFITPDMFNDFARAAQLTVFNRLLTSITAATAAKKGGMDPGRNLSKRKSVLEDLSLFSEKSTQPVTDGIAQRPDDMYKLISITTKGLLSGYTRRDKQVEIVYDEEKIDRILRSTLSAPSDAFPVALVSDTIEVFPENIRNINVRYYRLPKGKTTANGDASDVPYIEIVDYGGVESFTANCSDFELPEEYSSELIIEIARMVGVNLKEQEVSAYSSQANAAQAQVPLSPKK